MTANQLMTAIALKSHLFLEDHENKEQHRNEAVALMKRLEMVQGATRNE